LARTRNRRCIPTDNAFGEVAAVEKKLNGGGGSRKWTFGLERRWGVGGIQGLKKTQNLVPLGTRGRRPLVGGGCRLAPARTNRWGGYTCSYENWGRRL